MIYIVLGMHKSGTTLISQILHKSGINMGDFNEMITYDQGNHYERQSSQNINIEILACEGKHSLDVLLPAKPGQSFPDEELRIRKFIENLNSKHENWGFKDPRTCLTYPIWERYLPKHKIIFVYRDPIEVWHHYRKYIPKRKIIERTLRGGKALKAWYIYNSLILSYLIKTERPYLVVNFGDFMNFERLITQLSLFTGISIQDQRRQKMYRSKPKLEMMFKLCSNFISRRFSEDLYALYDNLNEYSIK